MLRWEWITLKYTIGENVGMTKDVLVDGNDVLRSYQYYDFFKQNVIERLKKEHVTGFLDNKDRGINNGLVNLQSIVETHKTFKGLIPQITYVKDGIIRVEKSAERKCGYESEYASGYAIGLEKGMKIIEEEMTKIINEYYHGADYKPPKLMGQSTRAPQRKRAASKKRAPAVRVNVRKMF